jgi:hypothetical protein
VREGAKGEAGQSAKRTIGNSPALQVTNKNKKEAREAGDRAFGFSRPFHGLFDNRALTIPAINCWAITICPLRGLNPNLRIAAHRFTTHQT